MAKNAQSMGDCTNEAQALLLIANNLDRLGEFREAIKYSNRAEEIAKKEECKVEIANAILMQGQEHYRLGEVDRAKILVKEALSMHQDLKGQLDIGRSLNLLGLIHDEIGDLRTAREFKEQAIKIFEQILTALKLAGGWEISHTTLLYHPILRENINKH